MIVIGVLLVLVGFLFIYWNISYSPFKATFDKEMRDRLSQVTPADEVCRQEEIDTLPQALKQYCEKIGLVGSTKHHAVNIVFPNTRFVFNSEKNMVLTMDYDLWLLSDEPFRSAFITSSMGGVPFDGIDYCTDNNEGGMKGMVGKAVEIFDTHNAQMYKAGLISWLAEGACINPSILLSDYVTYKEINNTHVEATVTYHGVEGTGVFAFGEDGLLQSFESDERQEEEIQGVMTPIGWRADYKDYQETNGLLIPRIMQAVKVYPDREVVYFDSSNMDITYYK